jgi:hypothetical protein
LKAWHKKYPGQKDRNESLRRREKQKAKALAKAGKKP